jgi:hypothetical protein
MHEGDFEAAAREWRAAWQVLADAQPPGKRYHKGQSLHNEGLAHLFAGRRAEALNATLAALIEDAASLAEENPLPLELDRPAAHNLVYVFGLPGPVVADLGRQIRSLISRGVLIPDPAAVVSAEPVLAIATAPVPASPLRTPGEFSGPPERRVFIGGFYGRLDTTIRPLRDHLASLGYDTVVAADFRTPPDWGDDEVALALLHMCHFAIFDVSESAGQVEEIADVPETMR